MIVDKYRVAREIEAEYRRALRAQQHQWRRENRRQITELGFLNGMLFAGAILTVIWCLANWDQVVSLFVFPFAMVVIVAFLVSRGR